jgi:hypothetical protein
MRSNMYQSGVKCAADAAQEELKYFFKVVAKVTDFCDLS